MRVLKEQSGERSTQLQASRNAAEVKGTINPTPRTTELRLLHLSGCQHHSSLRFRCGNLTTLHNMGPAPRTGSALVSECAASSGLERSRVQMVTLPQPVHLVVDLRLGSSDGTDLVQFLESHAHGETCKLEEPTENGSDGYESMPGMPCASRW